MSNIHKCVYKMNENLSTKNKFNSNMSKTNEKHNTSLITTRNVNVKCKN